MNLPWPIKGTRSLKEARLQVSIGLLRIYWLFFFLSVQLPPLIFLPCPKNILTIITFTLLNFITYINYCNFTGKCNPLMSLLPSLLRFIECMFNNESFVDCQDNCIHSPHQYQSQKWNLITLYTALLCLWPPDTIQ